MNGPHHRSWWSTRQELVVVTGVGPADASLWLGALQELEEACRDVIDCWDESGWTRDMDARVQSLRDRLSELRQWKVQDR